MSSLRSRSIFASFAVMAIVAVAFAGISVFGDDSDAVYSGTESSPLDSLVASCGDCINQDFYVKIGTTISIVIDITK